MTIYARVSISSFILHLGGWNLMTFGPLGEDKDHSRFASVFQVSYPRQWQSSWIIWTVGWRSPDYPWNGIPNRSLIHMCCLHWTRQSGRWFDECALCIIHLKYFLFGRNSTWLWEGAGRKLSSSHSMHTGKKSQLTSPWFSRLQPFVLCLSSWYYLMMRDAWCDATWSIKVGC